MGGYNRIPERFESLFDSEKDRFDKELMENISSTPLGKLLGLISTLPEIRHEKVQTLRSQIAKKEYNESDYLDNALDMVLEELIGE